MDKLYSKNAAGEPKKASRASSIIALIVCFLMAFVMWLYVMQTENPEYEETFTRVPIVIADVGVLSENSNLSVISGWEQRVSVTVKGRRSDIVNYSDTDINAFVSVAGITHNGTYNLDISVELPDGLQLVGIAPTATQVTVDEVGTKTVPVVAKITSVKHAADCELGEPVANPAEITVTGPITVLEKISAAAVELELGQINGSVVVVAPFKLVNKNEEEVDNPYVTASVDSVTVTVPLYETKTVPLTVAYKHGYYNDNTCTVVVEPSTIILKGENSVLKDIESILVKTLDEKQITSDRTETVTVPLPSGVVAKDGITSAKISIKHINTVQRTFKVKDIDIIGTNYILVTSELDITLRGPESILKRLTATSIEVSASVEDIDGTGEFRVEAEIKLPEAYKGVVYELGTYYIQVTKK